MPKNNVSVSVPDSVSQNMPRPLSASSGSRVLKRLSKITAGVTASSVLALWATAAEAATIPVNVSTVQQLYAAFQLADSRASDTIEIRLAPGTYSLVKNTSEPADTSSRTSGRLKLKYGKVKLIGGANRGASFDYVIDGGWYGQLEYTTALAMVGQAGSSFRPELYIYGVRLQNAWGEGKPPIQVLNARLDMYNSTVYNTRVDGGGGGGLYANNNSSITINRSFFQHNSVWWAVQGNRCGGAFNSGGALQIANSHAWIENSTFMGGIACRGGGLHFTASSSLYRLVVNQSTFSENNSRTRGAGIFVGGAAGVTLHFNTISHNVGAQQPPNIGTGETQAGGGITFDGYTGSLRMVGNIVGNNLTVFPFKSGAAAPDAKDCHVDGTFTSSRVVNGNLLREQGTCSFIPTGPLVGTSASPVEPGLGGLMEGPIGNGNSGTILVRPVIPGSRALGAFQSNSNTSCFSFDQTDIIRILSPTTCTIGAVENAF
jgi:hypothetical protein